MSVELSPQNKIYVELKRIDRKVYISNTTQIDSSCNNLCSMQKLPKLCLSLDSGDGPEEPAIDGLNVCNSCRVLKRLVSVKDIAIDRLTEDREDLKLKLTK